MWGPWSGAMLAGALVLAGLVALAFGTSIAVFGVFIALGLVAAIAVGYGFMRASQSGEAGRPVPGTQPRNPRSGGAPAAGEGAPPAETAPAPHEPANTP